MSRWVIRMGGPIGLGVWLGVSGWAAEDPPSGWDRLRRCLVLYQNDGPGAVRRLSVVGRAQLDAVRVEPDEGEPFEDVTWRRFRLGLHANLAGNWTAHVEANLDLNESVENWYTRLTETSLAWAPNPDLTLKALKQHAGFTLDGKTSSKELLTLERNNLSYNLWFPEAFFNGLSAAGSIASQWTYQAGFFSSNGDPELGWDEAGGFALGSVGLRAGDTAWRLDYVYQDGDPDANTRPLEQVVSLNGQWRRGSWSLRGDLAGAGGDTTLGQGDLWGLVVMPFYDFSPRVQGVFRYTYLNGDGDNSLRLNRYENRVVGGRGDAYQEGYAGFNLYLHGHQAKWQTGLTWADLRDQAGDGGAYRGAAVSTGLRVSW